MESPSGLRMVIEAAEHYNDMIAREPEMDMTLSYL